MRVKSNNYLLEMISTIIQLHISSRQSSLHINTYGLSSLTMIQFSPSQSLHCKYEITIQQYKWDGYFAITPHYTMTWGRLIPSTTSHNNIFLASPTVPRKNPNCFIAPNHKNLQNKYTRTMEAHLTSYTSMKPPIEQGKQDSDGLHSSINNTYNLSLQYI